ncbi:MAG TPA: PDZ domain-containing protein [Acidimicrobiales bacterium]
MERGGPFTGGENPEDPDGAADDAGAPQRGWLAPEDRLWRHPSEVSGSGLPRSASGYFAPGTNLGHGRRARRAALAAGVVGVAALATTLAVVLAFIDTKGTTTASKVETGASVNTVSASTTSLTSMPVVGHDVMRLVASVRPSMVGLEPVDATGPTRMTGVVLPGGELIVTAASAVAGASQLDVVTATGRRLRGQVVGSDARSGVAVIATSGGLAPATFADEDVQPSDLDIVACLCAGTAPSPSSTGSSSGTPAAAAVGMVEEVGTGVVLDGGINLVNTIEAEMPLGPTSWGGVLLDNHGRVLGILDAQMSLGNDTIGLFVPAPLAEGVALELAKSHRVSHGWLGVQCTEPVASGVGQVAHGAEVTTILPGSPALQAGLEPGDVVVGVGTHHVDSVADLQERLYTVPPGTTVQLQVERGGGQTVITVKLADSPGG